MTDQSSNSSPLPPPPKTKGWPLVGALPALVRGQFDFLLQARERYGDLYTLDLGVLKVLVCNNPRHAEHLLRANNKNYGKGPLWENVRRVMGNGVVTSEGAYWLRQRRMMQPTFQRARLAALTDLMVETIDQELATWSPDPAPFDVRPALDRVGMRVIARTLFGTGISTQQTDMFAAEMTFVLDHMLRGILATKLPKAVPVPGDRRYQRSLRKIDSVILDVIARTREAGDSAADTMLSKLINAVDPESGEQMTDQQVRDEAMTFFLTGYESSSVTGLWALELLARHPDALAKHRAEVDAVLGDRLPTLNDVMALPYTTMVVREVLRLRPTAFIIPRVAIEADEIDGYSIPAGMPAVVNVFAIHHHPEHWERPMEFEPERFSSERSANRHPFAWMPFGGGPRLCIGKDFSMVEMPLLLAMIAQRFDFTPAAPQPATPKMAGTLKAKGDVLLNLTRRDTTAKTKTSARARAESGAA